jgi:hypothetical protein
MTNWGRSFISGKLSCQQAVNQGIWALVAERKWPQVFEIKVELMVAQDRIELSTP